MGARNDVAIYVAMKAASKRNLEKVLTGDGSDELFGGYTYLFDMSEEAKKEELSRRADVKGFSSLALAEMFGIETVSPFFG
jgi:asparagine synthase (glutamine-hydrolysing)